LVRLLTRSKIRSSMVSMPGEKAADPAGVLRQHGLRVSSRRDRRLDTRTGWTTITTISSVAAAASPSTFAVRWGPRPAWRPPMTTGSSSTKPRSSTGAPAPPARRRQGDSGAGDRNHQPHELHGLGEGPP
jgi:hypothetical protein